MRQSAARAPFIAPTATSATAIHSVAARHRRVALAMTVAANLPYIAFLLLVAYAKPFLGRVVADGLTLGLILGPLVVAVAWLLCCAYVVWANRTHDAACRRAAGAGAPR